MDDTPTSIRRSDVTRNEPQGRYELRVDDELVSIAVYSERPDAIVVPHIETRADRRGNGYSHLLMAGVIDDVRARSLKIVPTCGAARAYVAALPDAHEIMTH